MIFVDVVVFLLLLLGAGNDARPLYPLPSKTGYALRQPLQTSRPYNIAHRGSNGEIPEETAAAYEVNILLRDSISVSYGFHGVVP